MTDSRAHWGGACDACCARDVCWFQPGLELSLKLIDRIGAPKDTPILDIGCGASTLAEHLLERGFHDLSVLDSSFSALDRGKARLEGRSADIEWIAADITRWKPPRRYGVWHDRAVLHLLVEPAEQMAYAHAMRVALAPEDWAIIGCVAPGDAITCDGRHGVQQDAVSLGRLFGEELELMETHGEFLVTPCGANQVLRCHVFRRKAPARRTCE